MDRIQVENPTTDEVTALLARHHAFAHAQSPPEAVHALDVTGLLDPRITLYGLRRDGVLLGLGALKQSGPYELEVKSMHVAAEARGLGVGKRILDHLLAEARTRGATLVNLETGSTEAFTPALSMYEAAGFTRCERFGDYPESTFSTFMSLVLSNGDQPDIGVMNRASWSGVTVDCLDPEVVGAFWSGLLGLGRSATRPGWVRLGSYQDAQPVLNFQPVSTPKRDKVRIHLDVTVHDIEEGIQRVVALGGRWLDQRHDYPGAGVVVVMADPEDNEFCLVQYYAGDTSR